MLEFICKNCGEKKIVASTKADYTYKRRLKNDRHFHYFCSRTCMKKYLSENEELYADKVVSIK